MLRKRKKPIRLSKKTPIKERIKNWVHRNYGYIIAFGFVIGIVLFAYFMLIFMPGTESGVWYNGGVENAIQ